jgi:lipopolysaccharide/colanic/teichoic acid biosynthesis glycosyltransferase
MTRLVRHSARSPLALACPLPAADLPAGAPAAAPAGEPARPIQEALRRLLEIGLALFGLGFAAPLLALAALAAGFAAPGPVLERHPRIGRHGRPFVVWRLRARPGACGRFLRLCRIDDVLQFVNVLRGEMALVGPRPEAPEAAAERARWIAGWRARQAVRPGILGWAQLHGAVTQLHRPGAFAAARRMLAYDLDYIRKRSLALDLRILFAGLGRVFVQEEAR